MIVSTATLAKMQAQLRHAAEQLRHGEVEVAGAEVPADAQVGLDRSWCAQFAVLIHDAWAAAEAARTVLVQERGEHERKYPERD
jgi:hypothetical protein